MRTPPTNGRSVTRTIMVSVALRPSVATSSRSPRTGPSVVVAKPLALSTASDASRHPSPVARALRCKRRRPFAATVMRNASPRSSSVGRSLNANRGTSVPRHAAIGRRIAIKPSLNVGAAHSSSASVTAATAIVRMARARLDRCSCGASVGPRSDNVAASARSARRASAVRSATSMTPRNAPARSVCSRSMAAATEGCASSRRSRFAVHQTTAPLASASTLQTSSGVARGSTIQRDSPSSHAPAPITADVTTSASAMAAAASTTRRRARSRSTISTTVMGPVGS